MADLKPRDVIRVFDNQTRPPKWKRLICVCPRRRLFLRINSEPIWLPHTLLRQVECPDFLDWDSYVEFRELARIPPREFREALARTDNPLGRLSDAIARRVAFEAQQADTLSDERRRIVWEGLVDGQ